MYQVPDELTVSADGPVRVVTLNRPGQLNAANKAMHTGLVKIWRQLADDPSARAVVLTGSGRAFCAGGDIEWFRQIQIDHRERRRSLTEAKQIVTEMTDFPLPVVAAVNGPAIGLGASLMMMCDVVYLNEDTFIADPHVQVALVAADGGSVSWPLMTSLLRAKEYLLTGDRIPAREAERFGLANHVVPAAQVLPRALAFAHRVAALPWQAVQDTKRALNIHLATAARSVLDFALAAEGESYTTPENRAAVEAFLAK
jgi:enoyl-CoA hydratase